MFCKPCQCPACQIQRSVYNTMKAEKMDNSALMLEAAQAFDAIVPTTPAMAKGATGPCPATNPHKVMAARLRYAARS